MPNCTSEQNCSTSHCPFWDSYSLEGAFFRVKLPAAVLASASWEKFWQFSPWPKTFTFHWLCSPRSVFLIQLQQRKCCNAGQWEKGTPSAGLAGCNQGDVMHAYRICSSLNIIQPSVSPGIGGRLQGRGLYVSCL